MVYMMAGDLNAGVQAVGARVVGGEAELVDQPVGVDVAWCAAVACR